MIVLVAILFIIIALAIAIEIMNRDATPILAMGLENKPTATNVQSLAQTEGTLSTSSSGEDKEIYKRLSAVRLSEGTDGLTQIHYIDNADYFLANPLHRKNTTSTNDHPFGTCTSVAHQILLGYHNYYSDRRLIPQTSQDGQRLLSENYGDLSDYPAILKTVPTPGLGLDSIGTTDALFYEIFNLAGGEDLTSQMIGKVASAANAFLSNYANGRAQNWSIEKGSYQQDVVLSELDEGRPVVLGFDLMQGHSAHVVVAYGYATYNNEICYLTHYGWLSDSVQMLVPASWLSHQVIMHVNHTHQFEDMGETYNSIYRALRCTECGCTTLSEKYLPSHFDGGKGDIEDPFLIGNAEQFQNIGLAFQQVYIPYQGYVNRITYAFKLTGNIEIPNDWAPFVYDFTGFFDGNGYSITYNMTLEQSDINSNNYHGLFGYVYNASIHDLELRDCSITSNTSTTLYTQNDTRIGILAGGISGASISNIKIINPRIDCKIDGAIIGSIAGTFYGSNTNSCTVGAQNGTSSITNNCHGNIGGLAGFGDSVAQFSGCSVEITLTNTEFNKDNNDKMGEIIANDSATPADFGINANVTIKQGSCIAEGSLITLADGTQKAVETLTGNELLLVWNLQTGKYDVAPIIFIDKDATHSYTVISLSFSNGQVIDVISEHGFWNCNLNKYVYLDKNATQYIGHWFLEQNSDVHGNLILERTQLLNVSIHTKTTTAYSPVTYKHLCYFTNGMLSMPGGIEGLFNIFDVDAATMRYDAASMQRDIEKYGIFTYEEFSKSFPVSKNAFEAFNGEWLKVAIGKGLIHEQRLNALVTQYSKFLADV